MEQEQGMTRQQDFDDQAVREHYRALHERQARVEVAEQDDGESWTLHVALFGALVVALMFSTFF
jgi:glucan phosphorylase